MDAERQGRRPERPARSGSGSVRKVTATGPAEPPASTSGRAAPPQISSRRFGRFGRVLVVDDDDGLRRALVRLVRSWRAEALEATTVAEGKRMLSERPDLVITDVRLPDGSGREVAALAAKQSPAPPVLAMSGLASASEAFALAQCGVRIYLTKPFAQQELVEAVETFIVGEGSDAKPAAEAGATDLPLAERLRLFQSRYGVTEREMELVRLVMAGVPRSRCPELLRVSENTCKTMTRRLLQRCGARNVAEVPRLVLLCADSE